jgi:hypothetical protein
MQISKTRMLFPQTANVPRMGGNKDANEDANANANANANADTNGGDDLGHTRASSQQQQQACLPVLSCGGCGGDDADIIPFVMGLVTKQAPKLRHWCGRNWGKSCGKGK